MSGKRTFSLFLGLLLSMATILPTQVISNPVNPQIGENLWQMNYRQSIAIDDIMDTTTLCCNCDYFITQADIDLNGGGFIITQPGNWCLGENIITSQTILLSNVTGVSFDLKGRTISSTVAESNSIVQVTNCPKATIKNGTLIGLDLGSGDTRRFGLALTNSADSIAEDIHIEFFGSVDNPATLTKGNIGFLANHSYTEFNNCFATGPFLTGFLIFGDNTVLKSCEVSHFSGYQLVGPVTVEGIGYTIIGKNNYLENCKSIGGDAQPTPASAGSIGFFIQGNKNIANNCVALNHALNAQPPLGLLGGSGFHITGNNCELTNCTSCYNALYGIFNTGLGLTVCNNSVNDNGSNFVGTVDQNVCNLLCTDYISQSRLPFTISEPGVYCLSGNLVETAGNAAISIDPDISNVTINLNGSSISRGALTIAEPLIIVGNNCENILIENGTLESDGTSIIDNIGIFIPDSTCREITLSNITLKKFELAVSIGSGTKAVKIIDCDGFDNNTFFFTTNTENLSLTSCSISGGLHNFENHITIGTGCKNITIDDIKVIGSKKSGIDIFESDNITIANVLASENIGNGINCDTCSNIVIENTVAFANTLAGIFTENSNNIAISSCSATNNLGAGFSIGGATGGAIPGISPVTILGCIAQANRQTGIYLKNVGGVTIASCTSSGNFGGSGFHLDLGTWNAQVKDCVALSNGFSGFLTWDTGSVAGSPYNNRFHACHAAQNNTTGAYFPGFVDFSMSNTTGVIFLPPLAGAVLASIATIPPVLPLVPSDFSTYF